MLWHWKTQAALWVAFLAVGFLLALAAQKVYGAGLAYNRVVKVVDGDTVILNRSGKHVTCRLIGLNTPETVHPGMVPQPYGKEASDYLKWWIEGKTVRVDYEYPQGDRKRYDRYDRLLVYLWADKGRQLVNLEMVKRGYGRFESGYRTKYRDDFKAAELEAKSLGMGLWGLQP